MARILAGIQGNRASFQRDNLGRHFWVRVSYAQPASPSLTRTKADRARRRMSVHGEKRSCSAHRRNDRHPQISRLSTIITAAKPKTAIVRSIFVSVGISARNSIIFYRRSRANARRRTPQSFQRRPRGKGKSRARQIQRRRQSLFVRHDSSLPLVIRRMSVGV
jgi:hypothetical protein